jgi:hypothetical protein
MKKHLLSFMLTVAATLALSVVSVNAQSNRIVKANVPFDFNVGDQTFQAGKITTRSASPSSIENLLISSEDSRQRVFALTHCVEATKSSDKARLVFRKYGNRYYLAQVWAPGQSGSELPKSKSERSHIREMRHLAKNASQPEMIVVLADVN